MNKNKNGGNRKKSNVHGLYLSDWAKDLGIKLKFTVFEFENNMSDLMVQFSKKLTKCTADNLRFGATAAVAPRKVPCVIETLYPA
jgi:hypothetical protein